MCGIAGFTHNTRALDDGVIRRMTSALTHRGPDQQGCYCSPRIALGAVRLQVLDLRDGDQPFRSEDGQTTIVYNGEIYNFREIRAQLEALGHRFRSDCDTEVALRAFIEWDTACFPRFRGMFAMALWSERNNRLILARDRMGIKPLYIRRSGQDLVFGSELKALLAHPDVTRSINTAALEDFLSLNYIPSPNTLIEGIEKLASGHFLEWRNGAQTLTRWWNPCFTPDRSITLPDAASEIDRLLRESVREHLVSDVPLGIWASGGIDSSALLHYAADLGCRPLNTFSIAFENKSCDESPYFRDMASRYGAVHHEFELSQNSDLTQAIEEMAWFSDEPGADAGALPVWYLSKLSRQHVTVALSGEGGDELFGGYLTYRADALARPLRLLPRALRRSALRAAGSLLPVSDAKIGLEYKVKRMLEGSLLNPDDAHFFWAGSLSHAQRQRMLRNPVGISPGRLCADLPHAATVGALNRYLLADQRYYLQDNLLYKVDRMSMAHSLEVRPPFLDHRIVEFAGSLPENLKIRGSRQKIALKAALRGKLPESILNRRKSGLDIPAHEWFRGPLLTLLRDTVTGESLEATGLFDPRETLSLIDDHREKRVNAGFQLWGLMTLFLWLKKWNIEMTPQRAKEEKVDFELAAAS
jgi:asparagine synthase (glutamine-hydrolysing)